MACASMILICKKPVSLISRTLAIASFHGEMTQILEGTNGSFKILDNRPGNQCKPAVSLLAKLA